MLSLLPTQKDWLVRSWQFGKKGYVPRSKLPFTQLQAFEAVVRLGSFTAARTELEGSNVSRHVADLEDRLGKKLLLRSPRGALTAEGKVLFAYLTRTFDQTRRLLEAVEAGAMEPESVRTFLLKALFPPGAR